MKNYDKNIFKKKFSSYKKTFLFFFIIFTFSVILGMVFDNDRSFQAFLGDITPPILKKGGFFGVLLLFVSLFLSGATIYAPISSAFITMLSGVLLSEHLGGLSLLPFLLELISRLFTAYFLISYATFTTLTALRIFTDEGVKSTDLFTGTLFLARSFKGIFNFRYVGSYILFFFIFTLPPLVAETLKTLLL